MPSTTRLFGIILIALGIVSYLGTGRSSVTALIPAIFGALFVAMAAVAANQAARKHAMHAAAGLALVGLVATLLRLIPALAAGQISRPAVLAQLVMSVVLMVYIALAVKSFKAARRLRTSQKTL